MYDIACVILAALGGLSVVIFSYAFACDPDGVMLALRGEPPREPRAKHLEPCRWCDGMSSQSIKGRVGLHDCDHCGGRGYHIFDVPVVGSVGLPADHLAKKDAARRRWNPDGTLAAPSPPHAGYAAPKPTETFPPIDDATTAPWRPHP